MNRRYVSLHWIVAAVAAMLLAACASIGRPQGGKRDELPPEFVRSTPPMGATGVNQTKYALFFNENVQLEDAFNKVIVSPVQLQQPQISANGRRVSVELRDTLLPDATYTIDFGDAIKDLNEGNILDGFALDFSTGQTIDTLRISGMVVEAATLEPAQGILVGVYRDGADSAIRTLPFERVARTNQLGQFTIRNLPEGNYRIYALKDQNRDYRWDRTEDVAFLNYRLNPKAETIDVVDTLKAADGTDSLATRPGVRFLPNDVLLTWFNEDYRAQYLRDYARPERRKITLGLGAPADSLPVLRVVGGELDSADQSHWAVPVINPTRDSLAYWLADERLVNADSLRLSVQYMKPDSNDILAWTTDTLKFFFKEPKSKEKKKKKDEEAEDTVPKIEYMALQMTGGAAQDIYRPLRFTTAHPLESIDTAGIRLDLRQDTLWIPQTGWTLRPDSLAPVLAQQIEFKWQPGEKYRLQIDSAAVRGIYGLYNKAVNHEFSVKPLEDYANFSFKIPGAADSAFVVELLSGSDKPLYRTTVRGGLATFKYLNPGTYYARAILDANRNGKWDTGLLDSIQPEEVTYYSKKLNLKKNWELTQDWDIYELPVDQQKPYAILKNKPKLKRGEERPIEDEEELDEFGNPIDDFNKNSRNRGNNRTGTRRDTYSNPAGFGTAGFGRGGFQTNTRR